MSVCGNTEEDTASEEAGAPLRAIYEQKAVSKVVRVLTVLAYLLSVSLAAILLSVYYICVWKSPELAPANHTEFGAREDHSPSRIPFVHDYLGRSSVAVNETAAPATSESSIDVFNSTRPPDLTTEDSEASTDSSTPEAPYLTTSPSDLYNETNAT